MFPKKTPFHSFQLTCLQTKILSIFSMIPPIFATIELWWLHREGFAKFLRALPKAYWDEVLFIFLGPSEKTGTPSTPVVDDIENASTTPDDDLQPNQLPSAIGSDKEKG
jgi:hypothetical protein